jgi:hypothetical protein
MTDDIFYCKTLDFPPMPDHLVKQALSIIQDQSESYICHDAGPFLKGANGADIPGSVYNRYFVSPDIFDWVASNIPVKLPGDVKHRKIGIQTFQSVRNINSYAPHTDGPRGQYVLNYQIDTGGDNVLTKWYHEAGHSLIREPAISLQSFQNLTEVHSEHIAQGTWFCLHSRILHTVVNVERPRISLSIGLEEPV